MAKGSSTLTVRDDRTGKEAKIEIKDNAIPGTAFKQFKVSKGEHVKTWGGREEDEPEAGLRVFDNAYNNLAVIRSSITYIDGEAGILRYRGYPIEELAEKSSFLEVSYLLIYGALPTQEQLATFQYEIAHYTLVHSDMETLVRSFRYDAHPMSILVSSIASLSAFTPEANPSLMGRDLYTKDSEALNKQIYRILGKVPTLAAMAYRIRIGRNFVPPMKDMPYTENFLYMLDHLGEKDYKPNPVLVKALDRLFILMTDHEMNCGTAAMLHVGSSLVDPYSAIAAAGAALFGPLHGAANQAVVVQLEKIGSVENVPAFIERCKKGQEKMMGFGHRVYKQTDPRSTIIRKVADEVFSVVGREPLIEVAEALAKAALEDDYFIKRRLYPNVDFWSGVIFKAMGFPLDAFTVLFLVPRVAGYLAHWKQMMDAGPPKIWRPRQLYVGPAVRHYVPIESRQKDDQVKEPNATVGKSKTATGTTKRSQVASWRGKEGRRSKL